MIEEILREINKEETKIFTKKFIDSVQETRKILILACGRTFDSISLGLKTLAQKGYSILDPSSRFFPANSPAELLKKDKNITVLVVSGSGETGYIVGNLEDIIQGIGYIPNSFLITMNKNSTAGKLIKKSNGEILQVNLKREGILRDAFEISLLFYSKLLLNALKNKFYLEESDVRQIFDIISKIEKSPTFYEMVESLTRRNKVVIAGVGSSEPVARAAAIRLNHIKQAVGDSVNVAGEFVSDLRPGDIAIFVTYSGLQNMLIRRWYSQTKAIGGINIYFISKEKVENEKTIVINVKNRLNFGIRAYILLTKLALNLYKKFERMGYVINAKKYHSIYK